MLAAEAPPFAAAANNFELAIRRGKPKRMKIYRTDYFTTYPNCDVTVVSPLHTDPEEPQARPDR